MTFTIHLSWLLWGLGLIGVAVLGYFAALGIGLSIALRSYRWI